VAENMSVWLDEFFASYYKHRPVNATFIGIHTLDYHLPNFSKEGVDALCNEMRSLLEREPGKTTENLSSAQAMDKLLAHNFLEIQLAEFRDRQFHLKNPAIYTGEAVMGLISLFLRNYAPLGQRIEAAIARMKAVPTLLEQGEANVRAAPPEWTKRATRECKGAIHFLSNGIAMLMQQFNITSKSLREAADSALVTFKEHEEYLTEELSPAHSDVYACGERFFDMLMEKGHCLNLNTGKVAEYGTERVHQIQERLEHDARNLVNDGGWRKTLEKLGDGHPSQAEYLESFGKLWKDCQRIATQNELLTWPESPIRYTFMPTYFRVAVPFLHFLSYWAPAAFDKLPIHEYFVTPIEDSMPAEQQEQLLRATNFPVIKLNHVVHHGSVGHHVQNNYAYRAKSRIGQIAAIDCAYGIAMFCAGTMAEGWACYATNLMRDTGFYTELEQFAQLHSQLRQAARAVVDSNLHMGRFTFDQAVSFYSTEAGMAPEAATAEVVRNTMFPGVGAMYLLGADTIHKLREKVASKEQSRFNPRSFHDHFLAYGSVPVSLIAQDMLGDKIQLA
jgi:uncharacterized protein (DUF885 family)